ncbi:MAG TPA: aspartate 1-decarboxylase [bacterium]|nr:aspartate 1-decarboxylase [bacterium]HOL46675.1 aspartate 1-decarboxylase [bacterium]HPQ18363.1 aspartate 1-decarboxylase [bacterium]
MKRYMLKSKIHNGVVSYCELNYEGSIEIDEELMKLANLVEYEKVLVVNKNNGERFETYVIKGDEGSRIIGLNGAAARLALPGDEIIIFAFTEIDDNELKNFKPTIIKLDKSNNPVW